MGKVYDENEIDRVKNWVAMQEKVFTDSEKEKNVKQWFFLGSITVISAVALILIVKKLS